MLFCFMSSANCSLSRWFSSLAITTQAPVTRGKQSSKPAISKVIVVKASIRLNDGVTVSIARKNVEKFPRSISTPFGLPVEPDVYKV